MLRGSCACGGIRYEIDGQLIGPVSYPIVGGAGNTRDSALVQQSELGLKLMITFQLIKKIARAFPGTEVGTSYGTPAIKSGKRLLLRMHDKEDAIVLLLDSVDEQQRLIARDPMAFYITDHYKGYAAVLVRPTVEESEFRSLFEQSWRRVARKKDIDEYEDG